MFGNVYIAGNLNGEFDIYKLKYFYGVGDTMSKINVSIPENFLSEIDKYKKIKKVTRSQFLIDAARIYFNTIESEIALERKKKAINKLKKTRQDIMKLVSGKHDIDVVGQLREIRRDREKEIEKRVTGK